MCCGLSTMRTVFRLYFMGTKECEVCFVLFARFFQYDTQLPSTQFIWNILTDLMLGCVCLSMPINNAGLRFLLCFQTTVNDDSLTSFYSSSFTSRLLFCLINKFVAMRKYAVGLCVFHQSATFMEWNISFVIDSLSPFSYKLIRN